MPDVISKPDIAMAKGKRKDRPTSPLERAILRFLSLVDLKIADLSGPLLPPDNGGISRDYVFKLFDESLPLTGKTVLHLTWRLQTLMDRRLLFLQKNRCLPSTLLKDLSSIMFVEMGDRPIIRSDKIVELYGGPRSGREPPDFSGYNPRAIDGIGLVFVVFRKPFDELQKMTPEELGNYVKPILDRTGPAAMAQLTEGCTEISFVLTSSQARALIAAYDRGELAELDLATVEWRPAPEGSTEDLPCIDLSAKGAARSAQILAAAVRRETNVRPWRRMIMLCSPRIALWRQSHALLASDARAYATAVSAGDRSARWADWKMAWIGGPLFASVVIAAVLGALKVLFPDLQLLTGLVSGLVLGFAGAQVCSTIVSPLATAMGAVTIGLGFGLGHGLILGDPTLSAHLSRELLIKNPFLTINGGILGLSAPYWGGHWPAWGVVLLLLTIATGIALSGWFMAQPRRIALSPPQSLKRQFWIGVMCAGAGAGIGIVYGFTQVLTFLGVSAIEAAAAAFGIVGGSLVGLVVWWRSQSISRAMSFGFGHGLIAIGLSALSFRWAGSEHGFIVLAATTAWFHATWFTGAFALSIRWGTPRSAIVATTLEGAVGFTAFIASQWLLG